MLRVMSASLRVRNTGAVPVFGLTLVKSSGESGKERTESVVVSVSWRKNAHFAWSKVRSSPPKVIAQNLKDAWTSLKEDLPILEVEQAGQVTTCRYGLEKPRGCLVGVDA